MPKGAEVVLSGFGDARLTIAALCEELGAVHVAGDLRSAKGSRR
jgi:hypothetical protein